MADMMINRRLDNLTAKQRRVADLVCGGFSNQDIADKLKIKITTVRKYNARIFLKASVKTQETFQFQITDRSRFIVWALTGCVFT